MVKRQPGLDETLRAMRSTAARDKISLIQAKQGLVMNLTPVTLTGRYVQLVPLLRDHVPELAQVGSDPEIWKYMRYGVVDTEQKMSAWVEELLRLQREGSDLPFTVVHRPSGRLAGATRFLNISQTNRSLEVGGTWYGIAFQRTVVNTEAKFLLLRYAFEELNCVRVQFKTDLRNVRSQRAIERLGAVREGVLRDHMILPDGSLRSSVIYSILPEEWLPVKTRLTGWINSADIGQ